MLISPHEQERLLIHVAAGLARELAGHRACGTLLRAGPQVPGSALEAPCAGRPVAVMPLATGPAVLVTALANDAVTLRRRLHTSDR